VTSSHQPRHIGRGRKRRVCIELNTRTWISKPRTADLAAICHHILLREQQRGHRITAALIFLNAIGLLGCLILFAGVSGQVPDAAISEMRRGDGAALSLRLVIGHACRGSGVEYHTATMCGRVIQSGGPLRYGIAAGMDMRDRPRAHYPPRWNGAPSQDLLVTRRKSSNRPGVTRPSAPGS
jgi:hypothetical protein